MLPNFHPMSQLVSLNRLTEAGSEDDKEELPAMSVFAPPLAGVFRSSVRLILPSSPCSTPLHWVKPPMGRPRKDQEHLVRINFFPARPKQGVDHLVSTISVMHGRGQTHQFELHPAEVPDDDAGLELVNQASGFTSIN